MASASRIGAICHANINKVSGELFCLTYGAFVTQLLRDYSGECDKVNKELYQVGFDMGLRMVDELLAVSNIRSCRTFNTTVEVIAKVGFKMFLGISPELSTLPTLTTYSEEDNTTPPLEIAETIESANISLRSLNINDSSVTLSTQIPPTIQDNALASATSVNISVADNFSTTTTTSPSTPPAAGHNGKAKDNVKGSRYLLTLRENPLEEFVEIPEKYQSKGLSYCNIYCGFICGALESLGIKGESKLVADKLRSPKDEFTKIEIRLIEQMEDVAGEEYRDE